MTLRCLTSGTNSPNLAKVLQATRYALVSASSRVAATAVAVKIVGHVNDIRHLMHFRPNLGSKVTRGSVDKSTAEIGARKESTRILGSPGYCWWRNEISAGGGYEKIVKGEEVEEEERMVKDGDAKSVRERQAQVLDDGEVSEIRRMT